MKHPTKRYVIGEQGRHRAHPPSMLDGQLIMVCGDAHVLRYGVNTCIGATGTREVDRTA